MAIMPHGGASKSRRPIIGPGSARRYGAGHVAVAQYRSQK